MRLSALIIAIFIILPLSACATGTAYKLPQVSDTELAQVKKEGKERKDVFLIQTRSDYKNEKLIKNTSNRLLKNIRPLCDYTDYEACFFQVVYKSGNVLNATASENSKITMYRGLMEFMESEDEIAAVIAHEMGHHLSSHNKKMNKNALVGSMVAGMLAAAASANDPYYNPATDPTVQDSMNLGAAIGVLSYSREEEREADLLGAYLLARAGYDLKKAERVLWMLYTINKSDGHNESRSEFGDTHPAGPERIASWRKVIKEIHDNKTKLPYKVKEDKTSK